MIIGRYVSLVVLGLLTYIVGNIVYGPLALIFTLLFLGVSYLQAKNLKKIGRIKEIYVVCMTAVALLVSTFLPVWGYHQSVGQNENGIPHKPHAHYLWQFNHVH